MSIAINNRVDSASDSNFQNKLKAFRKLVADMQASSSISYTLDWDQSTYMPETATESRAWQKSFLARYSHNILVSRKMLGLINYLEEETNRTKLTKDEEALLKEILNQYQREKNVPGSLVQALARRVVKAHDVWAKATDFNTFAPALEKIVSIQREIAEHAGSYRSPYDALLERYEPGMTAEKLDKLFGKLREELIPIIKAIKALPKPDTSFLCKQYDHDKQMNFSKDLLKHIGFDFNRGRLDEATTPFSHGILTNDVRLTTSISLENIFYTIANTLHEGGHGLYDQGFDPSLEQTPLFDASSLGMHESQSRLYEATIGQGFPFWKFYFPKLQEQFPENLKNTTLEEFYKGINAVAPSFTWGDSDEVTYSLHVMVRYEIAKSLIEGTLDVKDVPKAWNEKMKEYLEITPSKDTEGPLQNSHWSDGDFGYFPTYILGNLYAAQIYNTLKKEIPDIEEQIAKGNMTILREWLREKIHKYGKTESSDEIMRRVTGESLNIKHYINYLKDKYGKLYNISFDIKEPSLTCKV